MKKLILPVVLALVGLGGGVGAGFALRPASDAKVEINPCGDVSKGETAADHAGAEAGSDGAEGITDVAAAESGDHEGDPPAKEYVKLNNQFIVPVVQDSKVKSLILLSVSIEVKFGFSEKIYGMEPKLRDAFLQVLFDHANAGGFDGDYTAANAMDSLRMALFETARKAAGSVVTGVLITDIVRQDS
jgi:hypothetical protein